MDRSVFRQQFVKLVQEVTIVVVHRIGVIRKTRRRRAAQSRIALESGRIGRDDRKNVAAAVAVVSCRVLRIGPQLVQVRRRKVNGQLEAVGARGIGHFQHNVALAITPRTGCDRVRGVASRPHAESIVVFADEHDHLATESLHRVEPFVGIQFLGIENRRVFMTAAPFHFVERVHAEVEKERPLQPHPVRLIGARQNLRRLFRDDGVGIAIGNHLLRGVRDRRGCIFVRERLPAGRQQNTDQPS